MRGSRDAGYKRIQCFVKHADPRKALWRLFQEQIEYIIGDPTEIARPQAWKTEYVGTLKDGKAQGFWALVLGTPIGGGQSRVGSLPILRKPSRRDNTLRYKFSTGSLAIMEPKRMPGLRRSLSASTTSTAPRKTPPPFG